MSHPSVPFYINGTGTTEIFFKNGGLPSKLTIGYNRYNIPIVFSHPVSSYKSKKRFL